MSVAPHAKNPRCDLTCHFYNLKLPEASFPLSSVKITYICNMTWFKRMPSTKSMYIVRLSWLPLPLPKGPKVFTCGEWNAERKAEKVTPRSRV